MKVRAISSVRVRNQQNQTVQLTPGETYDLDQDVAETLIRDGDAASVQEYETQVRPPPETKESPDVNATDAARELAGEEDIDLSSIEGTGSGGRVTKGDVEEAL